MTMADQKYPGEELVFSIPPASASREMAVGYSFLLLMIALSVSLLVNGFPGAVANPISWVLLLGISPLVTFLLLLAFPPESWQARLVINQKEIRYVPTPLLRWIGEPATAIAFEGNPREILIRRGSKDTYGGFFANDSRPFPYGFRIIVRWDEGHESELKIKTGNQLNPNETELLVSGITSVTAHLVRLVKREVGSDGTVHDMEWIPEGSGSAVPAAFAKLVFAGTPLLGGFFVGLSGASDSAAALAGLILWLGQTAIALISTGHLQQRSRAGYLSIWLISAFTFAASYSAVFLISANFIRAQ